MNGTGDAPRRNGRSPSTRLGIEGFDQLVPEGLPPGASVLILVPPSEEKDQLAAQFVLEGLRNGDAAIALLSDAGLRDLARRLGNMAFDPEAAVSEGRYLPLEWGAAAAGREGTRAGTDAVKVAVAAGVAAKKPSGLRILFDVSGSLPESLDREATEATTVVLAEAGKSHGALSLFLFARARAPSPALLEEFDAVLDLRPLKPAGLGLAVIALGGTPLPRSHFLLNTVEGRLVLEAQKRAAPTPASGSVECPVCASTIPAGAAECPVCKSPRPVRRPGESEVLDYISAMGTAAGLPEPPAEPSPAPAPPPPPPPKPAEAAGGREAAPARREPARRGLTNGLARKRKMVRPAAPPGRVNGLTSSIQAARRGMTNGLTNGNGFTNGLGSKRFAAETRRGSWRVYAVPLIAGILLTIPLFFAPVAAPPDTLGIDGAFGEWSVNRVALSEDPALPGSVDLVGVGIRADPDRFFGYIETREALLAGDPTGDETDAYRLFVDVDDDAGTGYRILGIGADLQAELAGAAGRLVSASLLEFPAAGDGDDWSLWGPTDSVRAAVGAGPLSDRVEFVFPRLGARDGAEPRIVFHSASWDGREDSSGVALSPTRPVLVVDQRSVAPMTFGSSTETLLELRVRSPQGTARLASLVVTASGTLPPAALRVATLRDGSSAVLATDATYSSGFQLILSPPLDVTAVEETLTVEVDVDLGASGTLGLRIAQDRDVGTGNATVSLVTTPVDRDRSYVGVLPQGVSIDGGFAEWPAPLADAAGEGTTGGNRDVDLLAFDSVRTNETVAVYGQVAGRALRGGLVAGRNPGVPGAFPPDTDRDGVPDSVEAGISPAAPFDFDNDGERDADEGGDRDSDGSQDYPAGADLWLNTTIPVSYPAPYAGRTVTVFIGPVVRPPARGEDTIRVFIDGDANPGTGYAASVGADWMVQVTGRGGTALSEAVFRFTGTNPGAWSWVPVPAAIEVDVGTRGFELAAVLPTAPVPGTEIVLDLRDWRGRMDESQVASRGLTRSSGGARIAAGAYEAVLPADAGGPDPLELTTDRFRLAWKLVSIVGSTAAGDLDLDLVMEPLASTESLAAYPLTLRGSPGELRYRFGPGSLKEEIVLPAPGSEPLEAAVFRFSLSVDGADLIPLFPPRGARDAGTPLDYGIVADGSILAILPSPFGIGADGGRIDCEYRVPFPGALDIACDEGLAEAPYPLTIDPSVVFVLSNEGPQDQASEFFSWSLAAGNFNGDGYIDVLLGAPFNDKNASDAGMAYIFFGPFSGDDSTPSVALRGNGTGVYRAGYTVASGDFNADGYDDAVIAQQNQGPTLVYYGMASWPSWRGTADVTFAVPSPVSSDSFGRALAAGNFNDASGDDLAIGRPFYPVPGDHGRVYVYFSPFSGSETAADLTLIPLNDTGAKFGSSLAAGRIDSDTKDDLVVGEIQVTWDGGVTTYGRFSFFKGSSLTGSGSISPDASTLFITAGSGSLFGTSIAVGNLNSDSYEDVLVGAPGASSNAGRAYVFLANSGGSGFASGETADATLQNQSASEKFGTSVLIGDFFNDGTNDAVVGAEAYSSNQGRVYAFNNPLSDQTPDETLTGLTQADGGERFGRSLAGGKGSSDSLYLVFIGAPYWDDTGETNAGRAAIASIPEFSDAGLVAGIVGVVVVLVARRRRKVAA